MIPGAIGGLYALRAALDRAIEALTPLEPVIAAWEATQENAAARPAQQARAGGAEPLYEAPRPSTEPSEPAPTPANGAVGAEPGERAQCEHAACGRAFDPGHGPGARKRYCGPGCRKAAAAERARAREREAAAAELDPELLPDQAERPFRGHTPFDSSDHPEALRPPALPWEQDRTTGP